VNKALARSAQPRAVQTTVDREQQPDGSYQQACLSAREVPFRLLQQPRRKRVKAQHGE
jgi:hypothetical protein